MFSSLIFNVFFSSLKKNIKKTNRYLIYSIDNPRHENRIQKAWNPFDTPDTASLTLSYPVDSNICFFPVLHWDVSWPCVPIWMEWLCRSWALGSCKSLHRRDCRSEWWSRRSFCTNCRRLKWGTSGRPWCLLQGWNLWIPKSLDCWLEQEINIFNLNTIKAKYNSIPRVLKSISRDSRWVSKY